MKILAIDPGTKRIGLAASDPLHLSVRLLPVLKVQNLTNSIRSLAALIREEGFQKVLIGHPLNMDGSQGPPAEEASRLASGLKAELAPEGCEILLWDERLTSFEAEERLKQKGVAKAKAKAFFDSLAAEILLEDYLHTTEPATTSKEEEIQ